MGRARWRLILLLLASFLWREPGHSASLFGCRSEPWRQYCVDGDVGAIAWSPDGKRLALSLGFDVGVAVLDLESGRVLWQIKKVVFGERSIAVTADGRYVVTATADEGRAFAGDALDLLEIETGRRVRSVAGLYPHQAPQVNVGEKFAASADGRFLAMSSYPDLGRPVVIYSAATWQEFRRVAHDQDFVTAVAISADSRTLALGSVGGNIAFFDLASGRLEHVVATPDYIKSLAFSPDGRLVLVGNSIAVMARPHNDPISVWRVADGARETAQGTETASIHSVAWSPDVRHLAWSSSDKSVHLWDRETGGEPVVIATVENASWAIAFSPDGRYLAIGGRDRVFLHEIAP